ncbi:MAG: hypothetical protein R2856_04480 [Caldilineaceae bacterium]
MCSLRCWRRRPLRRLYHRTDEFEALYAKIQQQMKQLYLPNRVYVVAATGSAMQEAAIRNACADG